MMIHCIMSHFTWNTRFESDDLRQVRWHSDVLQKRVRASKKVCDPVSYPLL